jgi:biopolymer transport protein TolR
MAEPQDPPLSAAQRSRIRRLSQPHEPGPGEEAGEIALIPYLDIITNIMMFVLASISVSFVASIDTTPPAIGGGKVRVDASTKSLNLAAIIVTQGITLKTSGGNIATGCEGVGSGVTVPKSGEDYDLKGLTACAKRLKNANVAFKEETQVTITASSNIDYKTVIDVMDALRNDGEEELFPEVHFGAAK